MRLAPLLALLLACTGDTPPGSDKDDPSTGDDSASGTPECTDDADCESNQICEDDECQDGDRDNGAGEATAIVWDEAITGEINPKGDSDYYSFTAEGGEFVRIHTVLDEGIDVEETGYDGAITLRDSAGKVVASVADYPTGAKVNSYDAILYAYLATAGTYTIEVEDIGTFNDARDPLGGDDYDYTLTLTETGSHTRDPDAFDDATIDVDIAGGSTLYAVGVALETEGDADYVDLSFPYGEAGLYFLGAADLGGSEAIPQVSLYTREGVVLTDKEGVGEGVYALYPAMEDERYVLELTDANGGGGETYWFFVYLLAEDEGDAYAVEEESNDTPETATEIAQYLTETSDGEDYTYGRVQGAFDPDGDVDSFLVEGMDSGYLIACLNSSAYGGAIAPSMEIYDSAGALVESAEGDASRDDGTTVIENISVTGEDYTIVLRGAEGDSYGPGAWYRMIVYVTSFETENYSCP